jgi:hypothetical protein
MPARPLGTSIGMLKVAAQTDEDTSGASVCGKYEKSWSKSSSAFTAGTNSATMIPKSNPKNRWNFFSNNIASLSFQEGQINFTSQPLVEEFK